MKRASLQIKSLEYSADTSLRFAAFADDPYAIFLDSCHPYTQQGRYDIFSTQPTVVFQVFQDHTLIKKNDGSETSSSQDPFQLIQHHLLKLSEQIIIPEIPKLPFTIGALGYFGYDLARRIEKLPHKAKQDISLPDAIIGLYEWSVVVDHHQQQAWLIYTNHEIADVVLNRLKQSPPQNSMSFKITQGFRPNMTRRSYHHAFTTLQQHISQGDCYEANLCQRFSGEFSGSPWQAYQTLRNKNPAPFAAFMNLENGAVLSLSPECFLKVQNRHVETKPIKGTAPRFEDPTKDAESAMKLQHSEKDQAENLMIVDLLRNDLGRSCKPGSIKVPKLFALESFPNVHHLVSTVLGELEDHVHPLELLRACFPGGSITGAPKIRAMEIIENLEPHRRSLYCGNIMSCDIRGQMNSNIIIRTFICQGSDIHCYAGGAIISDSKESEEYQETLIKVGRLISILETFKS